MKDKVSVIGAGFVGTMTAQRIAEKDLARVVLVDVIEGLPQGKAMDIAQSAPLEGFAARITGTNDFSEIGDSRVVVVTAGFARQPGMTREELALKNGRVVKSVTEKIKTFAPEAILIMVTNPLDAMAQLGFHVSGFPSRRVIGMGGVLDSARFRALLAEELRVPAADVEALVIGSHGDTMIPLSRYATVHGIPVSRLIPREKLASITERTKNSGAEIVGLLKTGSAFHAPSASVVYMLEAILRESPRILPASVRLEGQFGISGVYLGVPIRLGPSGVEEIYELNLTEEELYALKKSAEAAKKTFQDLIAHEL
jgi:malate dehydrogenase